MRKLIFRLDWFLMIRGFMRVAHWISWRFHRNQFDVALWCVNTGIVLFGVHSIWMIIRNPLPVWMSLMGFFGFAVNAFVYQDWVRAFQAASKYQEANPGYLHPRHHGRWLALPSVLRVFSLFIGSQFGAVFIWIALLRPIQTNPVEYLWGFWMVFVACAMYFAATPPFSGERRKAKARAPLFGTLAIAKT